MVASSFIIGDFMGIKGSRDPQSSEIIGPFWQMNYLNFIVKYKKFQKM